MHLETGDKLKDVCSFCISPRTVMLKNLRRSKRKFYLKVKKHTETLVILSFFIGVLSLVTPFMVGDEYVLFQRIHTINLTPITEASGSFSASVKFSATCIVTVQRMLPNGTVITLGAG